MAPDEHSPGTPPRRGFWSSVRALFGKPGTPAPPPHVVAWIEHAEAAVTALLGGPQGQETATRVLQGTHPAGTEPAMGPLSIKRTEARFEVTLPVLWTDAGGERRTTTVGWTFDAESHRGANLISDEAPLGVGGAVQIDDHFRLLLYPALTAAMQAAMAAAAPDPRAAR